MTPGSLGSVSTEAPMSLPYDIITQAPPGTTHVLPADPLGFDQRPTWMKWGYSFTGPECGTRYFRWFCWHRGKWVPDSSFHPRENTVIHEYPGREPKTEITTP